MLCRDACVKVFHRSRCKMGCFPMEGSYIGVIKNDVRNFFKILGSRKVATKDMIQMHVLLELLFSLDCHFGGFNLKNEI